MTLLPQPSPDYVNGQLLSQGFTDERAHLTQARKRRRTIQNDRNTPRPWALPGQRYVPTALEMALRSKPARWRDDSLPYLYDVSSSDHAAPMITFASSEFAQWACVVNHSWGHGVEMRVVGTVASVATNGAAQQRTWFMDDGRVVRLTAGASSTKKTIRHSTMPTTLGECSTIAVRPRAGGTVETVGDSALRFLDDQGREYMLTRPVYGWWGAQDETEIEAVTTFRCRLIKVGEEQGAVLFKVVPLASDLATYPGGFAYFDPAVVISGSTALDDNFGSFGANTRNAGAFTAFLAGYFTGAADTYRSILRVASGWPVGNITGITFDAYQYLVLYPTSPDAFTAMYQIAPANAAWIEGTKTNAFAASGESCPLQLAKDVQNWAGGLNSWCGVIGTDILAEPGGQPETSAAAIGWKTWTVPPDWDVNVAGVLLRGRIESANKSFAYYHSSDSSTFPPYWTVSYSEGGGGYLAALLSGGYIR